MGTPDARQALKVPGRLCWNPTDLTGTYPFGGTALGLMRGHELEILPRRHPLTAEERGGMTVDHVYLGDEYRFAAILLAWDLDLVPALMLDGDVGGTTGQASLAPNVVTGSSVPGSLLSDQSGVLYFSPNADQHPGVLFYRALPMFADRGSVSFNLAREFGIPYVWHATPDDTGRTVAVELRQDMTL